MINVKISGIDTVINQLNSYKNKLQQKANDIALRLATYGLVLADARFSAGSYLGERDNNVYVESTERGYKIVANGSTVLFFEFGTGITYGFGHPLAEEYGMGRGTYPNGKGHWDDPEGWWLPNKGGHTYGNPPYMPMWRTGKDLEKEVERIAREVFND